MNLTEIAYNYGLKSDIVGFKNHFGEPVGGSELWIKYVEGQHFTSRLIQDNKEKEYHIEEFKSELINLCKKYSVGISFGCGCCGAGAYCKDIEFSFEINP